MPDSWLYLKRIELKTFIRVVFGIVWLIDGALKFQPGMSAIFPQLISNAGQGQPGWLLPWFTFWLNIVSQNPQFWVYLIGTAELCLAIGLIFGLLRKMTYIVGISLSLIIWAVPEGLGGPYGPGSTDIGTGIIYAFVFLSLILNNVEFGPSTYSLDIWLERRIPWWHKLAEFRRVPKQRK